MQIDSAALARHRDALDVASEVVRAVRPDDLRRPTPCAGWDLRALLAHMVGQNHGFADAVCGPADVSATAFAPRPVGEDVAEAWTASAERVAAAFAAAPAEGEVLLVEISEDRRFPTTTVLGFHLLDTVVHTWDVAVALGRDFHPGAEVAEIVRRGAAAIPTGPDRERPDSPFAPALDLPVADPWTAALALLGRRHDAAPTRAR